MLKQCRLCGGQLGQVLLEITEPDRFERHCGVTADNYRRLWVECGTCGAVNDVLPKASEEGLARLRSGYYEVDLSGGDVSAKYRTVMALSPEKSDNWQRVLRIRSFVSQWFMETAKPLKMLDIGAGTGVFLSRLIEEDASGWSATAFEPDPRAAAHLRSLGRFKVVEAVFTGCEGLRGYHLVTLNKVIEHVEFPQTLIKAARSALLPERGILYVEVPDKLTIGRRPSNDNILGALHYHLYDPASLARLLVREGFEPLRIERVFEPSGKITVFAFACMPSALTGV